MKRRSLWDLIDDEKTGRIQASKVWLHLGNTAATIVLFWKLVEEPSSVDANFLLVYMGCIMGGYGWQTLQARKQNASDTSITGSEDGVSTVGNSVDVVDSHSVVSTSSRRTGGKAKKR